MRTEPVIPKFETGEWQYYSKHNEDGTKDGSLIAFQANGKNRNLGNAYCIAKQPKLQDDGKWETHAKSFTVVPEMLKYLIEEWYSLGEKIMECEKILEKSAYGRSKYATQKRRDDYETKFRKVDKILKGAGAFDEDIW